MTNLRPYYGYVIYPFYCHNMVLREDTPWEDITKAENVNDLFFSIFRSWRVIRKLPFITASWIKCHRI